LYTGSLEYSRLAPGDEEKTKSFHGKSFLDFLNLWVHSQETPRRGGRQQPHQSSREIQKIQGGEEAPHNGGAVLPKDVQMTPFSPEGLINPID
jgi:hypothetical protein